MIAFYFNGAPNPAKVALMLEETGLAYDAIPIDTRKGQQFEAGFLKVNPNGKVPAIVDDGVPVLIAMRSCSILQKRRGSFCPKTRP